MMSAPFGGPPALPFNTADAPRRRGGRRAADAIYDELAALTPPRKHYQRYYQTREANDNMWHAPQGIHAFLRAYYHMKSADWKQNRPASARGAHRQRVGEAAALLRHGSRQGHGGDGRAGDAVAPPAIAASKWLPDDELKVYSEEYGRTGFQGGLEGYRGGSSGRFTSELQLFCRAHDRRAVDVHRRQERLGRLSESRARSSGCRRPPARRWRARIWSTAPVIGCSRSSRKR